MSKLQKQWKSLEKWRKYHKNKTINKEILKNNKWRKYYKNNKKHYKNNKKYHKNWGKISVI
jgi:formylmethanofuran dehydrogenase subunit A